MKRIKLESVSITFEDGCDMYLEYCKRRNLREGTINHYKQSYKQMFNYFNPDMPLNEVTKVMYDGYVIHLR